ncbi:enolase C-terminal domain-like protein [Loktanella salsilacus]|uniref:enolase C-terminal domain-like protein n=1 Tax=Loktanella salsilacus TaxID=195913 RepID=UPI003736B9E0
MRITDIRVIPFRTHADRWDIGHGRLIPQAEVHQTITCIDTDEGLSGYFFGGGKHGDQDGLNVVEQAMLTGRIKALLVGQDPLDREMIWKWLWVANIPEVVASTVDLALWDLAGRLFGQPVYKVMGGARDKVKAYASTYPNIGSPQVYADHARACQAQGYTAYKIHPHYFWNPDTGQPTPGRPSNIRADIETCRLVREAVGPDMVLMYDVWGTYHTLEETIKVGRVLEELDFYWFEHPMPEYRVESYVRLCRELSIPVLAPEIAAGGVFTRAEWILRGASDMSRMDVRRGGLTGCRKTAIVCEAYGIKCEIHMAGWGNLHAMGATSEDTSEYYEKGLLAPGMDYDAPHPYLRGNCDPMDAEGMIPLPQGAGLGYDIVWDYIDANRMAAS